MARYSFYLDENIPQEKALIDYLDPIGNKKGNAIKYLLVQGLALNGISTNAVQTETHEYCNNPKVIEQDNDDLDEEEIDLDI